jgi:hypothetical protein
VSLEPLIHVLPKEELHVYLEFVRRHLCATGPSFADRRKSTTTTPSHRSSSLPRRTERRTLLPWCRE